MFLFKAFNLYLFCSLKRGDIILLICLVLHSQYCFLFSNLCYSAYWILYCPLLIKVFETNMMVFFFIVAYQRHISSYFIMFFFFLQLTRRSWRVIVQHQRRGATTIHSSSYYPPGFHHRLREHMVMLGEYIPTHPLTPYTTHTPTHPSRCYNYPVPTRTTRPCQVSTPMPLHTLIGLSCERPYLVLDPNSIMIS